jgi:hypothetical protein
MGPRDHVPIRQPRWVARFAGGMQEYGPTENRREPAWVGYDEKERQNKTRTQMATIEPIGKVISSNYPMMGRSPIMPRAA